MVPDPCLKNCIDTKILVIQSVRVLSVHPGESYFHNLALGKPTKQFGQPENVTLASSRAVDGNSNPVLNKGSCSQTAVPLVWNTRSWWEVDLQGTYKIREVVITSTSDPHGTRLLDAINVCI